MENINMTCEELNRDYAENRRFLDLYMEGLDKVENLKLVKVIEFINSRLVGYEKNHIVYRENQKNDMTNAELYQWDIDHGYFKEVNGRSRFGYEHWNIPIDAECYKDYPGAYEYAMKKFNEGKKDY